MRERMAPSPTTVNAYIVGLPTMDLQRAVEPGHGGRHQATDVGLR